MVGIKYVSWGQGSGYGSAARRHILGLRRLGVPVTWTPMVPGRCDERGLGFVAFRGSSVGDAELDEICNIPISYDTVIVHLPPEYFPYWARREPGKRIVGHTVWETDKAPRHWPPLFQSLHLAIVPSEWNRRVFRDSGITVPIKVVPHPLGVNPLELNGANCDGVVEGIESSDFVFYTINTWTSRKRVALTIEAYLNAFTAEDPVSLVVKTSSKEMTWSRIPFTGRYVVPARWPVAWAKRGHRQPAKICLIAADDIPETQIRAIHRRGDCYVSLCTAEGWGMGAFDAAALGRPIVMTAYGGQRDFLPDHLAYLVDYSLEPVRDGLLHSSYTPDQSWAAPDVGHASALMRRVYEHQEKARERGTALGEFVRERFEMDRVAQELVEALG